MSINWKSETYYVSDFQLIGIDFQVATYALVTSLDATRSDFNWDQ